MSDLHFVTFGNRHFTKRRWDLASEIKSSGLFNNVFVYGDDDVADYNRSLSGTGGGWWWWKSVIQQRALAQIKENDILLYLDAGCYFNEFGIDEFNRYLRLLSTNDGFLGFSSGAYETTEKTYTKRDVFKLLDCDLPEYTDSKQIASGLFFIRKNRLSIKLIDEFVRVSGVDHCLNNDPSISLNYPEYQHHKNDQSIFSLLVKKIYKDHHIDLITLDQINSAETLHTYADEVDTVCNCLLTKPTELRKLKFPIITARINDNMNKPVTGLYQTALTEAMSFLGNQENTIFIGQQIVYAGNPMSTTLTGVSKDKMIELPVMEETQMGMSLGLAMTGKTVITFYPRWDFIILAANQLINHVDKYERMTGGAKANILIRLGKGSDKPLDPGAQHKGNYFEEFKSMCKDIIFHNLDKSSDILDKYKLAFEQGGVHVLVEYPEKYYV